MVDEAQQQKGRNITMRNLVRVMSVCLIVGFAAIPALAAEEGVTKIMIFHRGELPDQVNASVGRGMQSAEGESFEVVATDKVKMYNSGWARVLDKARKKAAEQGGDCIVVTSWGYDPNKQSSVKTMERVKKIEFEVARQR
jgi:basic membrane lipoprotein Med (substrate-binding protein (PBP1-ABC) superfamily)